MRFHLGKTNLVQGDFKKCSLKIQLYLLNVIQIFQSKDLFINYISIWFYIVRGHTIIVRLQYILLIRINFGFVFSFYNRKNRNKKWPL